MASKQEEEEEGSDEQAQSENHDPASWKKFFIIQTGRTNGAHQSVVRIFKSLGQKEAESNQDADYCLVFCPVTSRVGTDVGEAMEHLHSDKGAVLVVMHHTFNPDQVIPPSRRLVKEQRIQLTLDCLFYKDKLLKCQFNDKMNAEIKTFFPSFKSKTSWKSPRESHQTSSDGTSNEKKSEDVAGPGPSKNTTSSLEAGDGAQKQSFVKNVRRLLGNLKETFTKSKQSEEKNSGNEVAEQIRDDESRSFDQLDLSPKAGEHANDQSDKEDDPSKMIQNTETSATDRTEETREDEHQKTNQRDQKTKTSGEPSDGPDPPDTRRESGSRKQRTTISNQEQASRLDGPSGGNQSTNMDEPRQMLQNTETSATDGNEGDQKE
ncbi:unnamed protein product [Ophioblennius macclurei]